MSRPFPSRPRRAAVGTTALGIAAAAIGAVAIASPVEAVRQRVAAAAAPKPGAQMTLLLGRGDIREYDVATDPHTGTAYVAWLTNGVPTADPNVNVRSVSLCTLPIGATACAGGTRVLNTPDLTAQGLRVLVDGQGVVHLVWFANPAVAAEAGPRGGQVDTATSAAGGPLSAISELGDAPSNGVFGDAELGPDGAIWTVVEPPSLTAAIEVRDGANAPTVAHTSFDGGIGPGPVVLQFVGGTPVLAAQRYGALTTPLASAAFVNGAWTAFSSVPKSWSGKEPGLVATHAGLKLITTVADASYYPAIATWNGHSFGVPTPTGDKNSCAPSSHDTVTDASGRITDVAHECDTIAVANVADEVHAAVVRIPVGGTYAGSDAQVASTARGHAWTAWVNQVGGTTDHFLYVADVLLPALTTTKTTKVVGGSVTLTGPVACVPPVGVKIGLSFGAQSKKGWHVASHGMTLNGKPFAGTSLNGATLVPGKTYVLKGTAKVKRTSTGLTHQASVSLTFTSCPNP